VLTLSEHKETTTEALRFWDEESGRYGDKETGRHEDKEIWRFTLSPYPLVSFSSVVPLTLKSVTPVVSNPHLSKRNTGCPSP
jgi:hypothetical protein